MDGWITIGTKLDNSKFDKQMTDLEAKIDSEEKKQAMLNQKTAQYTTELGKATQKVNDLSRQYEEATQKASRLRAEIEKIKQEGITTRIFGPQMELERQTKLIQDISNDLGKAVSKQANLQSKVDQTNNRYEESVRKVRTLKNKIVEADVKAKKVQFKQAEKSIDNVQKGIGNAITKIGKLSLAVLGIRSAYRLVRQTASTLGQYNEQFATDIEYIRFALAQGLAPVLEKVVSLAQTLLAYVNYLVQRLFGVNLFANATADAFKKAKDSMSGMAKSSKEIKNNLASFDEINVLAQQSSATGGGALAPSIDIGGLENVEIPEWLKKIGDILEPITNFKINVDTGSLNNAKGVLQRFANEVGELEEPLKNWFTGDFQTLLEERAKTAKTVLEGLSKDAKMIGDTFLNTVLAPFLSTFVKRILPVATQIEIQTTKSARKLFTILNDEFQRFWQDIVDPACALIMSIWDDMWVDISNAWDKWGEPIFEKLNQAIDGIGELMQSEWDNVIAPVWENNFKALDELWDEHLRPLWQNLLNFFGTITDGILDIWNKTLEPFFKWFDETFAPAQAEATKTLVNVAEELIGGVIDSINGIFTALTGLVEMMVGFATGDWDKAWQGLEKVVKGTINSIIGLVNGMVGAIEKAINGIADMVNAMNIQAPFSDEVIYVKHVHFNRIPLLAKGGIIAKPTQAVIGEAGKEAVMPLENNTEWMDVLAEKINARSGDITIRFTGSASQLVRMLKPELDKEDKRTGRKLIVGGAY